MKLVQDPTLFDVLLLENLYGDVVSDLCAGMVGGLGVVPGANIGDEPGRIRSRSRLGAPHRRQGIANPLALLMSGVMLLNDLAETRLQPAATSSPIGSRQGTTALGRQPKDP